jgi:hypothetical protein
MSKTEECSADAVTHPSASSEVALADLTAQYLSKLVVVASGGSSNQEVAALFALEDRITARRDTTANSIKLKLLVTLRQIRTAYEAASDSALWDRLAREIEALV